MNILTKFKLILKEHGLEYYTKYYSIYKGQVAANDDPENRGRLQLKCPTVWGKNIHEKWALSKGMFSGKGIGFYAMPNIGDPVWVSFEMGNPDFPVWEYGWYPRNYAPSEANNQVSVFMTSSGNTIISDDKKETITIRRKDGRLIEVSNNGISLGSAGGSAEPAVLGNKNISVHDKHIDELSGLLDDLVTFCTTQIAAAGTLPVLAPLAPGYVTLSAALIVIKAKLVVIKATDVPATTSKIVNLD